MTVGGRGREIRDAEGEGGGKRRKEETRRGEEDGAEEWKERVEGDRTRPDCLSQKKGLRGEVIDLRRGDRRGYHISLIASSRYLI